MDKETMEKRWPRVFLVLAFMGVLQMPPDKKVQFDIKMEEEIHREIYSQLWDVEKIKALASEHYHCDFEVATEDMIKSLYGIWQKKDLVGSSSRYQGDGGGVDIFCNGAFTNFGQPYFHPLYFCCTASIEEFSSEECLNIRWFDDKYANRTAAFILVVGLEGGAYVPTERNYSRHEILSFDGSLVVSEGGDFFEFKKMAGINIWENFEELPPSGKKGVKKR